MTVATETLWYLEGHLDADLSLDTIATLLGISRFHVSRAFTLATGCAVSDYVRARRLSEAARALAAGAEEILSVAKHAGYGSHEAFTRAFRQRFGVTPEQVRARADTHNLSLMEPLRMNQRLSAQLESPRVVKRDAILIVGLSERYDTQTGNAPIPAQWGRFKPYIGKIEGQTGRGTYGVICHMEHSGPWEYIAGVEVQTFPEQVQPLSHYSIPPQTYAVFHQPGHITTIQSSWQYIWQQGLRAAGHQAAEGPGFEYYGERFDPETGHGGFELWVAVRD